MDKQKTKSSVLFLLAVVLIFYIAHNMVRDVEVGFEEGQTKSQMFLDLVLRLDGIAFDIDFINAVSRDLVVTRVPDASRGAVSVGRRNPFVNFSQPPDPVAPVPTAPVTVSGPGIDEESAVLSDQEETPTDEPDESGPEEEPSAGPSVQDGGVIRFGN